MLLNCSERSGILVPQIIEGDKCLAFVPHPLPLNPPLNYDAELLNLYGRASHALGELQESTAKLENRAMFLYAFMRKEAVLSSQIEGTQTSLSDFLKYEAELESKSSLVDLEEVFNYIEAMNWGISSLKETNRPLNLNLMKEVHARLLKGVRGGDKRPGDFRAIQNWISGMTYKPSDAIFIPPPPQNVLQCMSELETYMNTGQDPSIIKAGLVHAQLETIHPFQDGNGRIGRLFISFMLCEDKVIDQPILYLSLYFKKHRQDYYSKLQAVRKEGQWEEWIKFYLQGIINVSSQALKISHQIMDLEVKHRLDIEKTWGKSVATGLALLKILFRSPFITVKGAVKATGLTSPTCRLAINKFVERGWLEETTDKERNRGYVYKPYMELLQVEDES